ncbi:hypothetical protein WJX72_004637 [[Myrmecia] bisecta]|uniref:Ankyrin repeat protein n=1 Tax=[Myrmecia] bisecta TaxID=41462 RepID=A0AAW1PDH6_9CHLO
MWGPRRASLDPQYGVLATQPRVLDADRLPWTSANELIEKFLQEHTDTAEPTGCPAAVALETLEEICRQAHSHITENPPAMDPIWEADYHAQVFNAAKIALGAGASPKHELFRKSSPSVGASVEGQESGLTLPDLLKQGATPNRKNSDGDTVLHILLRNTINVPSYDADESTTAAMMFHTYKLERFADHAAYVLPAFKLLVDAGWAMGHGMVEAMEETATEVVEGRRQFLQAFTEMLAYGEAGSKRPPVPEAKETLKHTKRKRTEAK